MTNTTVAQAVDRERRVRMAYDLAADEQNHIYHKIKEMDDLQKIIMLHEIVSYCERIETKIREGHDQDLNLRLR